jgi:hypothetical protein
VDTAARTILRPDDYALLNQDTKEKDCLQIILPGGDHGMSGGPVFLSDYSKILGLIWMGARYEGTQSNLLCTPAAWITEMPLTNARAMRVPDEFRHQGPVPALASAPAVKSAGVGIKSFAVLPIPTGANVNCYIDEDYLLAKFNQQTLNQVLFKGRPWWEVTHPRTGFALAVPGDYKLAERVEQITFYNEQNPTPVLMLTATKADNDQVMAYIYPRARGGNRNAYEQLLMEVVRFRRGLLSLRLLTAPTNDDGFVPSEADRYCKFGDWRKIDPDVYSVGSNDVRMWRLYTHTDSNGQPTGMSTLSVIGIRGDTVVATATAFRNEEWSPEAPLAFATRFFILGTYSFVD